jgi:hypothetical protein
VLAEVDQLELDELSRGGRYQYLAAMTRRADAGRAMDIVADVALVSEKGCPRVQTHPHLNRAEGECVGHLSRCEDCVRRGPEGEEEGIALRVDLHAVVAGAGLSY